MGDQGNQQAQPPLGQAPWGQQAPLAAAPPQQTPAVPSQAPPTAAGFGAWRPSPGTAAQAAPPQPSPAVGSQQPAVAAPVASPANAGTQPVRNERNVQEALDMMDPAARSATIELARRLPAMIHAAVAVHGHYRNLTPLQFKKRMEEAVGTLPSRARLPADSLGQLYKKVMGTEVITPEGQGALTALMAALKEGPTPTPNFPNSFSDRPPQANRTIVPNAPGLNGPVPDEVLIVCNGVSGTFITRSQAIICDCENCKETAKRVHRPYLELSPTEFERHAGMGNSKKWKYTVRLADMPLTTLGQWLDNYGINSKYTKSTRDDVHVRQLLAGPPGTRHPEASTQQEDKKDEGGGDQGETLGQIRTPAAQWAMTDRHEGKPFNPQQTLQQQLKNQPLQFQQPSAFKQVAAQQPGHKGSAFKPVKQQQQLPLQQQVGGLQGQGGSTSRRKNKTPTALPAGAGAGAGTGATRPGGSESDASQLKRWSQNPEAPGLRSPTGKRWLADEDGDKAHDTRVGSGFQAAVPEYKGAGLRGARAPASVPSDARAGAPGPSELEALAMAAGPEIEEAKQMPRDALEDTWARFNRNRSGSALANAAGAGAGGTTSSGDGALKNAAAGATPAAVLSARPGTATAPGEAGATATGGNANRAQRQRKQPSWMKQTVDPNAVLGGKSLMSRMDREQDDDDEMPLRAVKRPPGRPFGTTMPTNKRPKLDQDILLGAEIDNALAKGRRPDINGWRITDSNQMAVTIHLGGVTFSGILPAMPIQAPSSPAVAAVLLKEQQQHNNSRPGTGGTGDGSVYGSDSERIDDEGLPPPPPAAAKALQAALQGDLDGDSNMVMDQRRAAAALEYERLLVSGPPPGAKCALCHGSEIDAVPMRERGSGGKSTTGLGGLMLVRTSAVNNAWVHDQCARWSPEVHDPTGDGILEGVKDAIRRGRMLRCKACGEKGATLGCLKRTCRGSYHLPCARNAGCLLNIDPYVVACPGHVYDLPDGLSQQLGYYKEDKKREAKRLRAEEDARAKAAAEVEQARARALQRAKKREAASAAVEEDVTGVSSLQALGELAAQMD